MNSIGLHYPLVSLLGLLGCAGPAAHHSPQPESALNQAHAEAPRVPVATTLVPGDPLVAQNCAIPTAPSAACPEMPPEQPMEREDHHHHHHHHPTTSAPAPAPEPAPKPTPAPQGVPATAIDPVCKMKVDPKTAGGGSLKHNGKQYWFCSSSCRRTFQTQNPGAK